MGREVRKVPADWQHPKDDRGRLIPLFDGYQAAVADWDEQAAQWEQGFAKDWSGGGWRPKDARYADMPFSEWAGDRPREADYMPDWPALERTHLQMYETCSEGTPLSPPMPDPVLLARWLADNEASAFGYQTASFEEWLAMIGEGWAVSAVVSEAGLLSGVSAMATKTGRFSGQVEQISGVPRP